MSEAYFLLLSTEGMPSAFVNSARFFSSVPSLFLDDPAGGGDVADSTGTSPPLKSFAAAAFQELKRALGYTGPAEELLRTYEQSLTVLTRKIQTETLPASPNERGRQLGGLTRIAARRWPRPPWR